MTAQQSCRICVVSALASSNASTLRASSENLLKEQQSAFHAALRSFGRRSSSRLTALRMISAKCSLSGVSGRPIGALADQTLLEAWCWRTWQWHRETDR